MRVIVAGGLSFANEAAPRKSTSKYRQEVDWFGRYMESFHTKHPISWLYTGLAQGFDRVAGKWASTMAIPCSGYVAEWSDPKSPSVSKADTIIKLVKPDHVLVFPGAGTEPLVKAAKKAKVPLTQVKMGARP